MNKKKNIGNILIAEDSQPIIEFLTKELSAEGYVLRVSKSGKDALLAVLTSIPDLILMDMDLPELNGLKVCRLLKKDEATRNIPVVFFGRSDDIEKKVKGFEAGAVDYISKPLQTVELLTRIWTHISLGRVRAELGKEIAAHQLVTAEKGDVLNEVHAGEEKLHSLFLEKNTVLQALKRRDEQYRTVIDNANESIIVIQDGKIKFVNQSTLSLTGYSDQKLKTKLFEDFIYPDDRPLVVENFKKGMNVETAPSRYIFRLVTATGTIKWVEISAVIIKWEGKTALLNFLTDISERKLVEETLYKERKELERTVQIRTSELRESLKELTSANLRLEETGRYKSRFLNSMNHELRTPLNSIIGFSELLNNENFGVLNEKQSNYARLIESSGKLLMKLISDLLDLSRIDAGNMVLDLTVFSPWEFIGTITEMMGIQFREKSLDVSVDIPPDAKSIRADLKKCKQIMVNLLMNAVKYTPKGGKITIRASEEANKMLRVEVSDTGIGISKEDCQKLFMDFYQIDRQHDEQLHGTGIGLALSRRLVELQGGKIGVLSEPGKGSSFWFTLPYQSLMSDYEQSGDMDEKAPPSPLRGRKILIAEDDQHNLILLMDVLTLWDHEIIIARNGQEAIDLFISGSPDLVLMDLRMPVMDGMEATLKIREIENNQGKADGKKVVHIPIIALTANVSSDTKQSVLKSGFDMYLPKPAGIADIEDALKKFLK
jgi:PAS domain S-box-containing protein